MTEGKELWGEGGVKQSPKVPVIDEGNVAGEVQAATGVRLYPQPVLLERSGRH